MVATINNLDTANLFIGNDDPANSQYLVLINFKLPVLEEVTRNYNPGGGIVGIDMAMRRLNTFTFPFSLNGIQPDVLPYFMGNRRTDYTVRGNLANIATQEDIPFVATITGRMVKVEHSQFTKDTGIDTDYEVKEIVRYKLVIGTEEKYFLDAFRGPAGFRIDGQQPFRNVARNIGLV